MLIGLLVLVILIIAFNIFMQRPQFGRAPSGERLKRIQASGNYKDKQFQNKSRTPALADGETYGKVMRKFFFGKKERNKPSSILPSIKTDLLNRSPNENILVWFGHSSYFMQLDGKKFLVDPVFSGHASPVGFTTKSFKGSDIYTTEDLPEIDYLFLSHDHYDHLDYQTIVKLKPKIKKIVTGLGVGAHLERWGYDPSIIFEMDWNEEHLLENGFTVHTTTARHFSGRKFKRNGTIWLSIVLITPSGKIFIGGDSGYDIHFKTIGEQFGPFELVILENGQYNESWKYIHMMPEEVVQAAEDLKAKNLLPVHWGKFALSVHAWDEPIIRVVNEAKKKNMNILHPMIGEAVSINHPLPSNEWWKNIN